MKYTPSGLQTVDDVPTLHRLVQGDARDLSFIPDESIHLVLTSPPYWTLKRYNDSEGQMGHIEEYDEFLAELRRVWAEAIRVLVPGGRLVCVVGDVCLSRRENNGRHTVVPLHADICVQCRRLGFDNLNPIIWHKISNASYEVSNGSKFLGKPYEPNAIIKNDIEFILMQRKPGGYRKPTEEQRRLSMIPKDKFDKWFQQFWIITGASTKEHPAPFPFELASRLVQMFSFIGDTVLDPFCGTATTMLAALKYGRNSIGVELDTAYCRQAASRLMNENTSLFGNAQLQIELKPHSSVEAVAELREAPPAYKAQKRERTNRRKTVKVNS
jgi:site-specific DNA-methyltransferase (adenine-specific)